MTVKCENCLKEIPAANAQLHLGFCLRNNWKCPQCGDVVRKDEKEKHIAETHSKVVCECGESVEGGLLAAHKLVHKVPCECGQKVSADELEEHRLSHDVLCQCGEKVPANLLEEHKAEHDVLCECGETVPGSQFGRHKRDLCMMRELLCRHCEMPMQALELFNHEENCGTRTEMCYRCNRYIMLKDLERHELSNCAYPAAPTPTRPPQREDEEMLDQMRARMMGDFFYVPHGEDPDAAEEPIFAPRQPGQAAAVAPPGRVNLPASRPHSDLDHDHVVPCPYCGDLCADFEETQIHILTACAKAPPHSDSDPDAPRPPGAAEADGPAPPAPGAPTHTTPSTTRAPLSGVAPSHPHFPIGLPGPRVPFGPVPARVTTGHPPPPTGPPQRTAPARAPPPVASPAVAREASGEGAGEGAEEEEDALLPCELCGEGYPMSGLMQHQVHCQSNPPPASRPPNGIAGSAHDTSEAIDDDAFLAQFSKEHTGYSAALGPRTGGMPPAASTEARQASRPEARSTTTSASKGPSAGLGSRLPTAPDPMLVDDEDWVLDNDDDEAEYEPMKLSPATNSRPTAKRQASPSSLSSPPAASTASFRDNHSPPTRHRIPVSSSTRSQTTAAMAHPSSHEIPHRQPAQPSRTTVARPNHTAAPLRERDAPHAPASPPRHRSTAGTHGPSAAARAQVTTRTAGTGAPAPTQPVRPAAGGAGHTGAATRQTSSGSGSGRTGDAVRGPLSRNGSNSNRNNHS